MPPGPLIAVRAFRCLGPAVTASLNRGAPERHGGTLERLGLCTVKGCQPHNGPECPAVTVLTVKTVKTHCITLCLHFTVLSPSVLGLGLDLREGTVQRDFTVFTVIIVRLWLRQGQLFSTFLVVPAFKGSYDQIGRRLTLIVNHNEVLKAPRTH